MEQKHMFTNKMIANLLIPVVLEQLLNSIMGTADTMMVSNVGSAAISAVSLVDSINVLVIQAFSALAAGGAIVCAQYIGQKNVKRANESARQVLFIITAISVGISLICLVFQKPMLRLIFGSVEAEVMRASEIYFFYTALSFPFIAAYDSAASIFRAQDNTKGPMLISMISNVMNIAGNAMLIWEFHMGVAGAGLATVGANATSAVQILYFLTHEELPIRLSFKSLTIDHDAVSKILKIGVPAGLQGMVFSLANVCIQSGINSFGAGGIAGSAVELNYEYFAYYLVNAFAQTVVTFTGQNYGAKDEGRCKKIFRLGMLCSVISCGILSTIFVVFRTFFIGLFTSDPSVYHYAQLRFLIVLTFECLTSSYEISGGCLRGFGRSMTPAILTVFGSCVLRLIWLATVCNWFHDYKLLMAIYPISWVLTGTMVLVAYFRTRKKLFL